jgi:hypothetical protein
LPYLQLQPRNTFIKLLSLERESRLILAHMQAV